MPHRPPSPSENGRIEHSNHTSLTTWAGFTTSHDYPRKVKVSPSLLRPVYSHDLTTTKTTKTTKMSTDETQNTTAAAAAAEAATPTATPGQEAYEEEHVHSVYEQIASHFSSTRYKVGDGTFSYSLLSIIHPSLKPHFPPIPHVQEKDETKIERRKKPQKA